MFLTGRLNFIGYFQSLQYNQIALKQIHVHVLYKRYNNNKKNMRIKTWRKIYGKYEPREIWYNTLNKSQKTLG